MAKRRQPEAAVPDVRMLLAAHYREMHAHFGDVRFDDGTCFLSPWPGQAARLDRGEPFEVRGWEVMKWVDGVGADDSLRLEPDGAVTLLRRGVVPPPDPARMRRWR